MITNYEVFSLKEFCFPCFVLEWRLKINFNNRLELKSPVKAALSMQRLTQGSRHAMLSTGSLLVWATFIGCGS